MYLMQRYMGGFRDDTNYSKYMKKLSGCILNIKRRKQAKITFSFQPMYLFHIFHQICNI